MGPRNVNPRNAFQVIGTVAAGGSVGGLCLLAEERRRRVAFAQRIIENGRRLQFHKSYDTLAPLEIFDVGSFWGPKEEEHPADQAEQLRLQTEQLDLNAEQLNLDDAQRPPKRQLSNWEWRHRNRKHRTIPTASPTTLHTGSAGYEDSLDHWDTTTWPPSATSQGTISESPESRQDISQDTLSNSATMDQDASMATLTTFAAKGPVTGAKDFFDSIAHAELDHTSPRAVSAHRKLLMRCWRTTRNMQLTKDLFKLQMDLMSQPDKALPVYNAFVSACVEDGDLQGAQDIADYLVDRNIRPDFEARSHVALARGKAGEWDDVEQELVKMLQNAGDAQRYSHCLDKTLVEYSRRHSAEAAVAFFTRVQERSHLKLTNSVARCFTESILRDGRIDLLQQWMNVLTSQGKASSITQSSFALLVQRILQSRQLKDNGALKAIRLNHLVDCDDPKHLVDLINSKREPRIPTAGGPGSRNGVVSSTRDASRSVERAMLNALARRNPHEALAAYRTSSQDGIHSSAVELRLAITACSRLPIPEAEWSDMAKKLIDDAAAGGLNTATANEALQTAHVQKTPHNFTQTEALQEVDKYFENSKPGRPRYQHNSIALASKLLNQGDAKSAMRVMKKTRRCLRELGQDFGIPAWTTILRALVTLDDPHGVRLVTDHIIKSDLLIDHNLPRALLAYGNRARNIRNKAELPKVSGEIGSALRRLKRQRREQREKAMRFGKAAARVILGGQPAYRKVDTQGVAGQAPLMERDFLDGVQT